MTPEHGELTRTLPLSTAEGPFSEPSIADKIPLSDARVRAQVSCAIMTAFLIVNLATLLGLYLIYENDTVDLRAKLVTPD